MAYPPTEKAKEVMYAALDAFGQTYEWRKAGYMLLDGKLLDFSQDQYSRVLEHQVIYDIIGDELPKDYTPKDILMSFLNYGNIRIINDGIDLSCRPTYDQRDLLKYYLQGVTEFYVDISSHDGQIVKSFVYQYPRIAEVLADIDGYFDSVGE